MSPYRRRRTDRMPVVMWHNLAPLLAIAVAFFAVLGQGKESDAARRAAAEAKTSAMQAQRFARRLATAQNITQRSRLEAARNTCMSIGRTNRTLIVLLNDSARRALRNPQPDTPPPDELRRIVRRYRQQLSTPGARRSERAAQRACRRAANDLIKPKPPVAVPTPNPGG